MGPRPALPGARTRYQIATGLKWAPEVHILSQAFLNIESNDLSRGRIVISTDDEWSSEDSLLWKVNAKFYDRYPYTIRYM